MLGVASVWTPVGRFRAYAQGAYTYPIGIPEVPAGLEPERSTPSSASQCPDWPTAASTDCYYVDNTNVDATDTENANGYPDKPRQTLPESVTFIRIEIVGGGSSYAFGTRTWTATGGSESSPAVVTGLSGTCVDKNAGQWIGCPILVATPTPARTLNFLGEWLIVQGLELNDVRIDNVASGNELDNVLFRWVYIRDWCPSCDTDSMFSIAQGDADGGEDANYNDNIVIYDTRIENIGDMESPREVDDIGGPCSNGARNWWYLDNLWFDVNGDSVRTGTNVGRGTRPNRGTNCYLGRNTFHSNGENGVDVKNSKNTVVSQNVMYNHGLSGAGSSNGPCLTIHEDAENTWWIFNICYSAFQGFAATNQNDIFIIGNVLTEIRHKPAGGFDATSAVHCTCAETTTSASSSTTPFTPRIAEFKSKRPRAASSRTTSSRR